MPRSIRYRSSLARQNHMLRRRIADLETHLGTMHQHAAARTVEQRPVQHDLLEFQGRQLAAGARMAALIAHELNTPLQTIANYVYLLSDPARLAGPSAALAGIQQEVERIAAVVQRLRTFQFADPADPAPVAVPALIDRVLLLIGNQVYRRNMTVERRFAAGLPRPIVAERRLTLALLNLLRAIITAAPSGSALALGAQVVAGSADPTDRLLQITIELDRGSAGCSANPEPYAADSDPFNDELLEPYMLVAFCHELIAEQGGSLHLWEELGGAQKAVLALPIERRPGS